MKKIMFNDKYGLTKQVSFMHANQMLLEGLAALGNFSKKLDGLFNNNNNMETKEMKIVPTEGYEIDKENSTFEIVRFKPIKKEITYNDIESKLAQAPDNVVASINDVSEKHAKKIFAISKIMNVAKYLNKGTSESLLYFIYINTKNEIAIGTQCSDAMFFNITFNCEEAAKQAIDILGEETIRLALSTDY